MAPTVQNSNHNLVTCDLTWKIFLLVTRATTISWKPRCHLRPVHMGLVVDKVGAGTQLYLGIIADQSVSFHHYSMLILASPSTVRPKFSLSHNTTHRNICVLLLLTKHILPQSVSLLII
jgi:hypothetical protein